MKALQMCAYLQIVSLLCCLALAAACDKEAISVTFALDQFFELPYGGRATCVNGDFAITFLEVVEDSRCPQQAICEFPFFEKVVILLKAETAGELREIELSSSALEPVIVGDYQIKLRQVTPLPPPFRGIEPNEYRATLIVFSL
ncbi:MAG: hypothetical protein KF852_03930 [Saprospiraceae bacterium]|nr:hypothetical protein [Saprospiraceae bacterium]